MMLVFAAVVASAFAVAAVLGGIVGPIEIGSGGDTRNPPVETVVPTSTTDAGH